MFMLPKRLAIGVAICISAVPTARLGATETQPENAAASTRDETVRVVDALAKKTGRKDTWNIQATPQHVYRVIELRYASPVVPGKREQTVLLYSLRPPPLSLVAPMTKEECREDAKSSLDDIYDKEKFRAAKRLWVDWDEGLIGYEMRAGRYEMRARKGYVLGFSRLVCLPMALVDDLDLVGNAYSETYVKGASYLGHAARNGDALEIARSDLRREIRYDPERFFARFEPYGIKPFLKIGGVAPDLPDTQQRLEAWNIDAHWNADKHFNLFPLGDATTLSDEQMEPPSTRRPIPLSTLLDPGGRTKKSHPSNPHGSE